MAKHDEYKQKAIYSSNGRWTEIVSYPKQKSHVGTVIFGFIFIVLVLLALYGYFQIIGY